MEKISLSKQGLTKHTFLNENGEQENISFIEWLKDHRIELNKILAEIKSEPFFNWLKWKLDQVFPNRNYNRAITMDTPIFIDDTTIITPTVKKFNEWYRKEHVTPLIKESIKEHKEDLKEIKGFIDVKEKEQEITDDLIDNVLLQNERTQEIDLALESIMMSYPSETSSNNSNQQ